MFAVTLALFACLTLAADQPDDAGEGAASNAVARGAAARGDSPAGAADRPLAQNQDDAETDGADRGPENAPPDPTDSAEVNQPDDEERSARRAFLLTINLPIAGEEDTRVKRAVDRWLSELPDNGPRPILVFEFQAKDGERADASQFERSLSLARFLAGPRLSRAKTVAFLPESLHGHAVLVAMACEDLAIDPDAEFGKAGIAEDFPDPTMRRGYAEIANRRRTIPEPVALGMLDPQLEVCRVTTLEGAHYLLASELEEFQKTNVVGEITRLALPGDFVNLPGERLREYGFASHLVSSRRDLAVALRLSPGALEQDPSLGQGWNAVQVELRDRITPQQVNQVVRGIRESLRRGNANLLFLTVDSPGGAPEDCMRLANVIADLDGEQVRTVAFVRRQARSDAVLPVLACDQLVMQENSTIGGPGDHHLTRPELDDLRAPIQQLANQKSRDWSLMLGLIDGREEVFRYRHEGTGEERFLTDEESEGLDGWERQERLVLRQGLLASEAESYGLARAVVRDEAELWEVYNLEQPPKSLEPAWAEAMLERLASEPWFARTLLFVAFFALMTEASSPGIGVPGFIAGLCFLLFFWSQFLNGSAGWLEVLLFLGGGLCIAIEIFAVPGFGIFGIGGGLMMLSSIVLASQTFVIPRNSYQVSQLPSSLFMVVFAMGGAVAAIVVMRHAIANSPLLSRLLMPAPEPEETVERERRESLVSWSHLQGKRGVATTQLTPSGKARFGDDVVDVISDGELVEKGANVQVVEVRGNHVLVQPADSELLT